MCDTADGMEQNSESIAMSTLSILTSPACLIYTTEKGTLQVCDPVLEQVRQLDGPLVVVAIAGLYRTGKSYLLNRLADLPSSNGFALGSTIQSKTKGIWVLAQPHPVLNDHYLVLLDTEGLGDVKKGDANHDNWIFCLATLLSSTLCFNAKGVIDEEVVKKLNFITELSQHVRVKSGDDSDKNFDHFFPDFIYVLRDFFLELVKDGKGISLDEYLDDSLTLKPETTESDRSYNLPRKCIRKYFKKRHCFAFGFPTSGKKMQKLDILPDSELSADFLEDTVLFCDYIYQKAPAKKLDNGQPLPGRMWASLVTTYVDAISAGKIPCVENAVNAMATIENTRVIKHCLTLYKENMETGINFPTTTGKILADHHFATLKVILEEFMKKSVFDKENKFQKELNSQVAKLYEEFIATNERLSEEKCRSTLKMYEAPYSKKLSSGAYACKGGYALYQADMSKVKNAYNLCNDLGVKKNDVFLEFFKAKWVEGQSILAMDKKVTIEERKAEEARMRAEQARKQQIAAEQAKKNAEEKAAERERALRENIKQLEQKITSEIANMQKHYDQVLAARLAEQERLMKEGFNQDAAKMQERINDLHRQIDNSKKRKKGGCVIL